MPLNAHPPTVTGAAFDEKRRCLERERARRLRVVGRPRPGRRRGAWTSSRRAASSASRRSCAPAGSTTSRRVDDLTLYEGMCRAASLGLPVAVHAESEAITAGLARRARAAGRTAMRDYLASRPAVAELQAIARAIALAAGERLLAARRPRLDRPRRRAGGRGTRPRRRRQLRDLPALPGAHRGGRRGARRRREVRAAAAPAPGARGAVARARRRHAADGRLRPLAGALGAEDAATTCSRPGAASPAARRCSRCCSARAIARAGLALDLIAARHLGLRRPPVPPRRQGAPRAGRRRRPRARRPDRLARRLRPRTCTTAIATAPSSAGPCSARVARTLVRGRTVFADGQIVGPPAGAC